MEKERAPQATMESLRRDDTAYDRGRRRQNVTSVLLLLLNNIDLVACPLFRGRWRLCLLSQCQGLLASPISLTISRPLEKVRWALDCLAQQILQGRGMSQAIPPWRIQGNNIPRNLSHPTQSYLGWDVAQALRNWHALCLLWSRGSWACL